MLLQHFYLLKNKSPSHTYHIIWRTLHSQIFLIHSFLSLKYTINNIVLLHERWPRFHQNYFCMQINTLCKQPSSQLPPLFFIYDFKNLQPVIFITIIVLNYLFPGNCIMLLNDSLSLLILVHSLQIQPQTALLNLNKANPRQSEAN